MPKIIQLPGAAQKPVKQPKPKEKRPRNKLPDDRYRVRKTFGKKPDGTPNVLSFTGKTLNEAKHRRNEYIESLKNPAPDPDTDPNQTVSHWVDLWMRTYGTSGGYTSIMSEKRNAKRLKDAMGEKPICEVKNIDIQKFARSAQNQTRSTVSKLRNFVNNAFQRAYKNHIIDTDPCDGIRWNAKPNKTHRSLEQWEIDLITDNWSVYRAGLWAMLMLYAGLRRGEALALQWEDIDFDNNLISITKGIHFEGAAPILGEPKTKSSKGTVPLLPELRSALLQAKGDEEKTGYICVGMLGQQVTDSIWQSSWKAFNNTMANILNGDTKEPVQPGRRSDKDAELRPNRKEFKVRSHDLRHTFASIMYDADVDILTAQKLMRHATPKMTMEVYTHLSEKKKALNIEKLSTYMEKSKIRNRNGSKNGSKSEKD